MQLLSLKLVSTQWTSLTSFNPNINAFFAKAIPTFCTFLGLNYNIMTNLAKKVVIKMQFIFFDESFLNLSDLFITLKMNYLSKYHV